MESALEPTLSNSYLSPSLESVLNTGGAVRGIPGLASVLTQGKRSVGNLLKAQAQNDRLRRTTSELIERLRAECRYIQEQREAARFNR